ncbi:unnamed protein product, partial [Brassica oleracea]
MGERKIPENDAKLSSAGVGKSLSVTSENRKMSPKEKSVKSPVREPHALEKSVKSPVTEPPQQKENLSKVQCHRSRRRRLSKVQCRRSGRRRLSKVRYPPQQKQQKSVKSPA